MGSPSWPQLLSDKPWLYSQAQVPMLLPRHVLVHLHPTNLTWAPSKAKPMHKAASTSKKENFQIRTSHSRSGKHLTSWRKINQCYVSLAFKQQNKLTVKIGLSAFISLRCKLSLTFLQDTHLHVSVMKCSNVFQRTVLPEDPSPKTIPEFVSIAVAQSYTWSLRASPDP